MNLEEEITVECPHCWEPFVIQVSTGEGDLELVEDCAVCCSPALIRIRCQPGKVLSVEVTPG